MNGPPPAHGSSSTNPSSNSNNNNSLGGLFQRGSGGTKRTSAEAQQEEWIRANLSSFLGLNATSTNNSISQNVNTSSSSGGSKRPRVRDYVGSRGGSGGAPSTRHMIADLGQRNSPSTMPSLIPSGQSGSSPSPNSLFQSTLAAEFARQHQFMAMAAAAAAASSRSSTTNTQSSSSRHEPLFPGTLVKATSNMATSSTCDKTKDRSSLNHHRPSSSLVEVSEDCGTPLDLSKKASSSPSPNLSAVQRLEDATRRLSESSDGSSASSVFPKKRGRKPKSLLQGASATATTTTNSSTSSPFLPLLTLHQQQQQLLQSQLPVPQEANKPRKRGRPPLMSPPPNIDVTRSSPASSSSSNKFVSPLDILQSTIMAQQQLAAAQAAAAAGFPNMFNPQSASMPNGMREALAHLYSAAAAGGPPVTSAKGRPPKVDPAPSMEMDSDSDDGQVADDFKPGTSEEDIRVPLKYGWRRYTIINKITPNGVKGDVVYISPEGKKLRTLVDIQKYLNKQGHACPVVPGTSRKVSRDNYSFSTKWLVGEFNQPNPDNSGVQLMRESEVINRIEDLRRMKRKKLLVNKKSGIRKTFDLPAGPSSTVSTNRPSSSTSDALQQKLKEEAIRNQAAAQMLQMASLVGGRLDDMKLLEMLSGAIQAASTPKNNQVTEQKRLEEERRVEEEKARILQEELKKQASAEAAKKKEVDMKKAQEEQLQKVQEMYRRKELQMMAEIEKERRRQHILLVRQMDFHKKLEERERRKEEVLAEKRLLTERRNQKKKLEVELQKQLKAPIDDMRLRDQKPLPVLNRIPGLKLPAKAFADILLVYEFLYNFGETLLLDLDSLPTLNSMQLALLNMDETSEEELLSILKHLLMCAIEDPGLPVPVTTIMGQKLKDAPINNNNMSEILRLYFQSFVLHRESAAKGQEGRIFRSLASNKPFLSLPPTLKAEILAYLSNELLCNQLIVKQIDENIESVTNLRKDKWTVDCDLRKFKTIKAKREKKAEEEMAAKKRREEEEKAKEEGAASDADGGEVKREDGVTDSQSAPTDSAKKATNGHTVADDDSGDSGNEDEATTSFLPGDDEEPEMTNEEVDKKIDKLTRQCTLMTNKLTRAVNELRVTSLGQDRFRRRYWVLPNSGGVFVEGMESGEPDELVNNIPGDDDEEEEDPNATQIIKNDEDDKMETEEGQEENEPEVSNENGVEEGLEKMEEDVSSPVKKEPKDPSSAVKSESLGISPMIGKAIFKEDESTVNGQLPVVLKTDKKKWFSLLPRLNPCSETMTEAVIPAREEVIQVLVNGEDQKDPSESNSQCSVMPTPVVPEFVPKTMSELLNHLTGGGSIDANILSSLSAIDDICPSLHKRLQQQKDEQRDEPYKIPAEFQRGWWRLTDQGQVRSLLDVLNERGIRERLLHKHVQKYLTYISTKLKSSAAEFDVTELDRKIYEECPFGAPQDSGRYSKEAAMRVDIMVIEEIENLEEKISNSSMQVRGWKPSVKVGNDPEITFKRKLISIPKELLMPRSKMNGSRLAVTDEVDNDEDKSVKSDDEGESEKAASNAESDADREDDSDSDDDNEDDVDTLSFAKDRLLATEAMIERRYLKPPLGFKANTFIISSPDTDEFAENAADENAPSGLLRWREAVREAATCFQLAVLVNFLEGSIAWDKSIMRASCQFCSSGENEDQLLLCDGCDKGYHMYCFKPKMEEVPDGDWFCFECQNKNTIDKVCIVCGKKGKLLTCDTCPKVFHPNCIDPPVSKPPKGKWSCHICARKPKKASSKSIASRRSGQGTTATPTSTTTEDAASTSSSQTSTPTTSVKEKESKKSSAKARKKEVKESPKVTDVDPSDANRRETRSSADEHPPGKNDVASPKKYKKSKGETKNDAQKDLAICGQLLSEMIEKNDSWPFRMPVNVKQFPSYKKIIKVPMDLQTIQGRLESGMYKNREEFASDINLVFDNCRTFNEDESPVGRAGYRLRFFFQNKWKEHFP